MSKLYRQREGEGATKEEESDKRRGKYKDDNFVTKEEKEVEGQECGLVKAA